MITSDIFIFSVILWLLSVFSSHLLFVRAISQASRRFFQVTNTAQKYIS